MYRIRKPNRVSRPVRATQRGTSTSYPHADYAKMARLRNRWAGAHLNARGQS
jgi:hypothetical protein